MTSALTFLERCHKDGDEFLNHGVRATGDKTWVSFVNVETKEQSMQWMRKYSPKQQNKTNSMAFSPQANYTDRATAACRRS
jgi:hypothetical protein